MDQGEIDALLTSKDVRPTANRISVIRELSRITRPVSIADLERLLHPMDKASIFRVLELFAEKGLVHTIDDGTRALKYELCRHDHHHGYGDQHVHFHCEKCGDTFCFDEIAVPSIAIPEGSEPKTDNYIRKGLCPKCSKG